jgi:hypothetical protein
VLFDCEQDRGCGVVGGSAAIRVAFRMVRGLLCVLDDVLRCPGDAVV